jgi:hypothetical protein
MAHQKNIKLQGTFENIIFYTSNGHALIRTKPSIVRQTNATKKAASLFGEAVKMSANLRATVQSLLPKSKDRNMMQRLDATFLHWLRTGQSASGRHEIPFPFVPGFEFNMESQLSEKLKLKLNITKRNENFINVEIPAFVPVQKIVAPADTSSVKLKIVAATYDSDNHTFVRTGLKEILIPYSLSEVTEQQIVFDLNPKQGNIWQ